MKKPIIILFLTFVSILAFSQVWHRPMEAAWESNAVCVDSIGNTYVSGFLALSCVNSSNVVFWKYKLLDYSEINSNDKFMFWIVKLNKYGYMVWVKRFYTSWGISDAMMKIDNDDKLVICFTYYDDLRFGTFKKIVGNHNKQAQITKLNSDGKLIWSKAIAVDSHCNYMFMFRDFTINSKNEIVITGLDGGGKLKFEGMDDFYYPINGSSCFWARYDEDGNVLDINNLFSNHDVYINSIATDSMDNIYLGGFFSDSIFVDDSSYYAYRSDMFLTKFTNKNELSWFKSFGARKNEKIDQITSIDIDDYSGHLYFTGQFSGNFSLDGHEVVCNDKNIVIGKLTLDGRLEWINNYGEWSGAASYTEYSEKIMVDDRSGFVYLTGNFQYKITFNRHSLIAKRDPVTSSFDDEPFITKFSSTGIPIWAKRCGGYNDDRIFDIEVNDSHEVLVSGYADTTHEFDFDGVPFGAVPTHRTGFFSTIIDTTTFKYNLPKDTLYFEGGGGNYSYKTNLNVNWKIESYPEWLEVNNNIQVGYGDILPLEVDENLSDSIRIGTIVFGCYDFGKDSICVKQNSYPLLKQDKQKGNSIHIYPNPVRDQLHFTNFHLVESIDVFNLSGELLISKKVRQNSLGMEDIAKGFYIAKVTRKNGMIVIRKIKK